MIGELDEQLPSWDELLAELKEQLLAANNRTKQLVDSKRRDISFTVGDWVMLRIHPYRQNTLFPRSFQKLSHCFFGPFQLEARIGEVVYRLKLPEGIKIHLVFHVSLLKKWIGEGTPSTRSLSPLRDNGVLKLQHESILQVRWSTREKEEVADVLVQWQGLHPEDATWEAFDQIEAIFPNFTMNLGDRVRFEGGVLMRHQQVIRVKT